MMPPNIIPDISDDDDDEVDAITSPYTYCDTATTSTTASSATAATPQSLCCPSSSSRHYGGEEVMSIKRDREREGRCGECGVQTYAFRNEPITQTLVKVPLSVEGEVHRGRCLLCYPLSNPTTVNSRITYHHNSAISYYPLQSRSADVGVARMQQQQQQRGGEGSVEGREKDLQVREALSILEKGYTIDIVDILSAMRRVPCDQLVQERASEMLWIQSWDDENSAAIGRVGGIPIILDAMARFPQHAHLQQCACETLQNLSFKNNSNRTEICDLGGVSLIVQAMMRNMNVSSIQQCGCNAIASLAANSSQDHQRRKDVIVRAGGIHAVTHAARRFPEDEHVILGALQALEALGHDPSGHIPLPRRIVPSDSKR